MFSHSILTIWGITTALKVALFVLCFGKGYRMFQAYVGFSAFKSLILWSAALANSVPAYTHVYQVGGFIENVLLFLAIAHLGALLFVPLEIFPPKVYRCACVAVTVVTFALVGNALLSIAHRGITHTFERACFLMLVVIVSLIILFSRYLGIPWRNRATWITLGLFTYLTISTFNPTPLAYLLAELTWLTGYIMPENSAPQAEDILRLLQAGEEFLQSIPKKEPTSTRTNKNMERMA